MNKKTSNLNFTSLINYEHKFPNNNITLFGHCSGEIIIEKGLNIDILIGIIYEINKVIKIFFIIKSISNLISSTQVLKFHTSSNASHPKRRFPLDNEKISPFKKRLTEIDERKMDLKDLQKERKNVEKAVEIEENPKISSETKANNRHLKDAEEGYPGFFDRQHNANETKTDSLNRVIHYLKDQEAIIKEEIEEMRRTPNQVLDDLPTEMPTIYDDGD
jgi:hypothetical protein